MLTLLIGAIADGLMLAPLAVGVFISYRIFRFPDMTVDGSFVLGAVCSARMMMIGVDALTATALALAVGALAGLLTGVLHTQFRIQKILAGILVMTALYTINQYILGVPGYSYGPEVTLSDYARKVSVVLFKTAGRVDYEFWGVIVWVRVTTALLVLGTVASVLLLLVYFFRTHFGLALRASGNNEHAVRALGVHVDAKFLAGMALSNGLVALSGSMITQEIGTVNITDGIGMIVTGLAGIILGRAVFSQRSFTARLVGAILGIIFYRIIIAFLLQVGVTGTDLKLLTALVVFAALVLPQWLRQQRQAKWLSSLMPDRNRNQS